MQNAYAQFMQSFFQQIDSETELDPNKLALSFADYYWRKVRIVDEKDIEKYNDSFLKSCPDVEQHSKPSLLMSTANDIAMYQKYGHKIELPSTVTELQNISILVKDTSLEYLTKRVPLIADTSVLAHYGEKANEFFSYNRDGSFRVRIDRGKGTIGCPSLTELGKWLNACKSMLLQGDLFYLPDIRVEKKFFSGYSGSPNEAMTQSSNRNLLLDAIVVNKKFAERINQEDELPRILNQKAKNNMLIPILATELPYIEDIDLSTFSKITTDETASFQNFRDLLRLKYLDLKQIEHSEFVFSDISKVSIDLRQGVRKLNDDFRKLKRKAAFNAIGASIAAITAVLVAVNSKAFGLLPGILGGGGGVLGVSKVLQEYLDDKNLLESSPYYYYWLFSRSAHRRK